MMRVSLKAIAGHLIPIKQPKPGSLAVDTLAYYCAECGASPMRVVGGESRFATGKDRHDTYEASAHCVQCKTRVGTLRVKMNTLFGLEEDERVLNGMCRVY